MDFRYSQPARNRGRGFPVRPPIDPRPISSKSAITHALASRKMSSQDSARRLSLQAGGRHASGPLDVRGPRLQSSCALSDIGRSVSMASIPSSGCPSQAQTFEAKRLAICIKWRTPSTGRIYITPRVHGGAAAALLPPIPCSPPRALLN